MEFCVVYGCIFLSAFLQSFIILMTDYDAVSALILLVGRQEGHLACKN